MKLKMLMDDKQELSLKNNIQPILNTDKELNDTLVFKLPWPLTFMAYILEKSKVSIHCFYYI